MEIEGFPWIFSRKKNLFKLIWFGHWGVTKLFFFENFSVFSWSIQNNFVSLHRKQIKNKIMSNSKVRKQLEAQSKNEKLLAAYKKKADLILNYQMCKAYFKDSALSILAIVEKILKAKYNLPWQEKLIRKALNEARGKTNATITIPQFKYEKKVHDILSEFVEKHLDKMAKESATRGVYPLGFVDLVEKYS